MPKKKSSKTPKKEQKNACTKEEKFNAVGKSEHPNSEVKEEKPPSVKKHSEIDEIFAGKKRKKPEVVKAEEPKLDAPDRPKKLKNKIKDETRSKNGFADPPPRRRKKTGDGLTIYTEEELGFGKADAGDLDCDVLRNLKSNMQHSSSKMKGKKPGSGFREPSTIRIVQT